jgi:predicted transcriptional regulator
MQRVKQTRISVSLTPEEIRALQEIANTWERSLSWVAARAIRLYLAESRTGQQAVPSPGTPGAGDSPR